MNTQSIIFWNLHLPMSVQLRILVIFIKTYLWTNVYDAMEVIPKSLLVLQQLPGKLSPELLGLLQPQGHNKQVNLITQTCIQFQTPKKKKKKCTNFETYLQILQIGGLGQGTRTSGVSSWLLVALRWCFWIWVLRKLLGNVEDERLRMVFWRERVLGSKWERHRTCRAPLGV